MSGGNEAADRHAPAAARAFARGGDALAAQRFGTGHIHDTFAVGPAGGPPSILLQRINERVFPQPLLVVENVGRICRHLYERLRAAGVPDRERRCLHPLASAEGALAHRDTEGGVWRAFTFIGSARTFDTVGTAGRAQAAARAFGAFAAAVADLSPAPPDTIPGFHDFDRRVADFEAALAEDPCGRRADATPDLDALRRTRDALARALERYDVARLPRRIVHNDCKINNVMFDVERDEGLCVIDLDTVMEGLLLHDFGDLLRTASCRAPEDESDVARMRPEPALVEALCAGYLAGAAPLVTAPEREALAVAGPWVTLETALRFATDHLRGDTYFRIARPGHNLQRARAQGALARRLLEAEDGLRAILARAVGAGPGDRGV